MNAHVHCVGCEQRQLDAERVRGFLLANDMQLVDEPGESDLIVLVTCAVDERNESESLSALRSLLAQARSSTRILVGGCLPSISPDRLVGLPIHGTFSPRSMESLDNLLDSNPRIRMHEVKDPNRTSFDEYRQSNRGSTPSARKEYDEAKNGFKIRIDHGCLMKCAYCVIRHATGLLQSVPLEDVLTAFAAAVEQGEATIILMGGDTGAYGIDCGTDFPSLLERILAFDGSHRVFVHDCNVNWLVRQMDAYIRVLSDYRKSGQLRAICFPIQSGSDALLQRMRRPYKRAQVIRAIRWIREHCPSIRIGTHIIVGFPGETDTDFQDTIELLTVLHFDFVTCFRYSEHSGAPSAQLSNKVPESLKADRLEQLGILLGDRANILA